MYPLQPLKVFVHRDALQADAWRERMARITGTLGRSLDAARVFSTDQVPQVLEEIAELWPPEHAEAGSEGDGPPRTYLRPLVFTTFDLREERPDISALVERSPAGTAHEVDALLGRYQLVGHRHPRQRDLERDQVCWPTHDFGAMIGCPHGCLYCGEGRGGRFISVAVNVQEYMDEVVGPTAEKHPWQRCFRMIGWGSDLMAFEPENGLFDAFTRKLAEYDRYAYFHSGGGNVDWIADLPRKDRLIGVWSLTCDRVARQIEPGSADITERAEAGRKCRDMGVPVRHKWKPIIPVRDWRREYEAAIEESLRELEPESVGFCVLGWMDWKAVEECIGAEMLDPEYAAAAEAAQERMAGVRTGPFPHEVRAEVYRFFLRQVRRWSADVPLYLSTESREIWDELAEELGQDPEHYVCGCSSVALPGRKLALSEGCPASTYDTGLAE